MAIIGREPPADIVIPGPQVSAAHAEILHEDGDVYRLRDLGSSNGTFVNGRRVQSATVRLSDRVSLGSFAVDLSNYQHLIPKRPVAPVAIQRPLPAPSPGAPSGSPRAEAQPSPRTAEKGSRREAGLGTELAGALAAQQSFTGKAFFTWFLYWIFWVPGFIMNLVYLSEANRVKRLTGEAAPGHGCLTTLLVVYVLLPLVVVVAMLLTGGAVLHSLVRVLGR